MLIVQVPHVLLLWSLLTSYHSSLAPFIMLIVPKPSLLQHHFIFTAPLPPSSLYHNHHTSTLLPSITNATPSLDHHYFSTITTTPLSLSLHLHDYHHCITSPSQPTSQDCLFTSNTVTTLSFYHPYISSTPSLIHQCTTTNPPTPFLYNEASTITASLSHNHQFTIISSLHFQLITMASSLHQKHLLVFPSLHDSYLAISDGCYQAFLNVPWLLSSICIAPQRLCVVCGVHWPWRESY